MTKRKLSYKIRMSSQPVLQECELELTATENEFGKTQKELDKSQESLQKAVHEIRDLKAQV